MKLIHPRIELFEQQPGVQGMYDMIELCGKTSYKSPVKGGTVAEEFTQVRINEGHYAVLEFGTVYLLLPCGDTNILRTTNLLRRASSYTENPYSRTCPTPEGNYAITTNLRVLVENGWTTDLQYWCEPTEYHAKRYTARIITNIGVTRELCRHRSFSFCEQSTRYCNYSSGKFGEEVTYVIPELAHSLHEGILEYSPYTVTPKEAELMRAWCDAEKRYKNMLISKAIPQEARDCLPLGTATEICVCGFKDAWEHFFALRYHGITGKPHPSMYEIAEMLHIAFEEKGIIF